MRGSRETMDPDGARHPLRTAALLCAIAAPLILAGVLEIDPGEVARTAQAASAPARELPAPIEGIDRAAATSVPLATAGPSEPTPGALRTVPVRSQAVKDLKARGRDDARRLRATGEFTLQFAVMCRDENVRQVWGDLETDARLYVLPASVDGRSCYRLCYGGYASALAAREARAIPDILRRITTEPRAISVAEVAP